MNQFRTHSSESSTKRISFLVESGDEYREYKEERRKRERTCGGEIVYPVFDVILMKLEPLQVSRRLRYDTLKRFNPHVFQSHQNFV